MCHKYLSWAFEMSMGKKKESCYFSCFSDPKSSNTASVWQLWKNRFLGPSKTIQTYILLVLELLFKQNLSINYKENWNHVSPNFPPQSQSPISSLHLASSRNTLARTNLPALRVQIFSALDSWDVRASRTTLPLPLPYAWSQLSNSGTQVLGWASFVDFNLCTN